jgi:hypothetical protein
MTPNHLPFEGPLAAAQHFGVFNRSDKSALGIFKISAVIGLHIFFNETEEIKRGAVGCRGSCHDGADF